MMKVYKAVHERENKCKELHKEMNMNVGPTRLVRKINTFFQQGLICVH